MQPPVAQIKPHVIKAPHGASRTDNYYWLNDRENPEVIDYLTAENKYLKEAMSHTESFQANLFEEMKSRIKEDDSSVPYFKKGYYYYTRYEQGGQYAIHCRRKGSMEAPEEIVVNGNELGENQSFLNFYVIYSPNQQLAAIVKDTVGRNFYTITIKDLTTGTMLPDQIESTRGNIAWMNDNQSFYYVVPDPKTLREYQVYRHILGGLPSTDALIYEEKDETLSVSVSKSRSEGFIFLHSSRTDAAFAQFMSADMVENPRLIAPLQANVKYYADHAKGADLLIYTNLDAVNYKLVRTPFSETSTENWQDVIPHRADVFLEEVAFFKDFMVIQEKTKGLSTLYIQPWEDSQATQKLEFDEPAYYAGLGNNPAFDTPLVRYNYTSMTTPASVYDYQVTTGDKLLKKQQPVLGDFQSDNYQTERIYVPSRDGKEIPLSLVYRKDRFKKDGSAPGWIYGYGSYGYSMEATFSSTRLSLLDRGFVFAIAHIRGGQEMGGAWYEEGKMMQKKNTFYDFIDCSMWLQDHDYVAKDKLFASGGSAGGLLMGAVVNMAPEVYKGVVAAVPFVDVVTTMLDESIPLTTFEWLEWGNPNIKSEYDYMLSYSPYDNVSAQEYPNLLVTTGLHDSQVQYWEPAKWVAKMRTIKTDDNRLFLHTNMDAGHGGASGRFDRLKEIALEYAFVFDLLGISN
ncbi:MAG: S9 family peptidase [Saprospiraceae bacterium]